MERHLERETRHDQAAADPEAGRRDQAGLHAVDAGHAMDRLEAATQAPVATRLHDAGPRIDVEGGASAVLAASLFHFGQYKIAEVKDYLRGRGVVVR